MMTQEADNPDLPSRVCLLAAYHAGTLLDVVSQAASTAPQRAKELAAVLISLHNDGDIDLVASFEGLRPTPTGRDFFLTRRVFEESLPWLSADVRAVLRCVAALWSSAGRDLFAGTILGSYARFCEGDRTRVAAALQAIEESPTDFAPLLGPTIASGAKLDLEQSLVAAVRLCDHPHARLRSEAVRSLGSILRSDGEDHVPSVLAKLEQLAARECDDELHAAIVSSACSIAAADPSVTSRAQRLLEVSLSQAGERSLHAASEVFGLDSDRLPEPLRDELLRHLAFLNPASKATIRNVDQGLSELLLTAGRPKAIRLLESLLIRHSRELSIDDFRLTEHTIQTNGGLLSALATRWFLLGDPSLCAAIGELTRRGTEMLDMQWADDEGSSPTRLLFAARKAIGYLFHQPVRCAQFVVSLMGTTDDQKLLDDLQALLTFPLLMNFTGSVRTFIMDKAAADQGSLKSRLEAALRDLDRYLEALKSIGELPALHPSERHRAAYHRHVSAQFAEAMKESQSRSRLLQLVRRQAVLYGRSTVAYIDAHATEPKRMEIEMKEHGFQIEMPRSEHLDMVGLDEMLKTFRLEQPQQ